MIKQLSPEILEDILFNYGIVGINEMTDMQIKETYKKYLKGEK